MIRLRDRKGAGGKKQRRLKKGAALGFRGGAYWTASFLAELTAFFGRGSSSTPSLYLAWALASSTSWARVKLRDTLPLYRSERSTFSPSFSSFSILVSALIETWLPSMLTWMSSFFTPGMSACTV